MHCSVASGATLTCRIAEVSSAAGVHEDAECGAGETAVHVAVLEGNFALAKRLMDCGCLAVCLCA